MARLGDERECRRIRDEQRGPQRPQRREREGQGLRGDHEARDRKGEVGGEKAAIPAEPGAESPEVEGRDAPRQDPQGHGDAREGV